MDIHRCRFVPYQPQSISTLAFSHRQNAKLHTPRDLRLALGRENGDIEIWNPLGGNWSQERILRGSRDRTIEQLEWTQDLLVDEESTASPLQDGPLRLFSSGGSPSITEWDLTTGSPIRHADGNLGDIWCFAAQPQWRRNGNESDLNKMKASPSQLLAAGCADGTIVLFTTADGSLRFLRVLSPAPGRKTKTISITWRDRDTVVAGYENGTIRVIDVRSRTVTRIMTLGKSPDGTSSVVWTLNCLSDGTILSGDSSGELKLWDAKTLSLTQRLRAHDADVLGISTSSNGNTIFTAGVDRKVVMLKQIPIQTGNKRARWQMIGHRRFHQHDVKALASFESKGLSVLVSGGMDTVPIVMSLRNWESEYHRTLPHLPQKPQMSCSSQLRLMLTWWDRELLVWHLPRTNRINTGDFDSLDQIKHQLLARIELNGDVSINSAQISEDGRMIVASTNVGVRLFQIRKRIVADETEIRTRPVDLPIGIQSFGASSVGFSSDGKWLFAVRMSNLITLAKVVSGASNKDKPQISSQVIKLGRRQRRIEQSQSTNLAGYLSAINCVSFSSDGRCLAVGDLSGAIDTWVLEGHEDLQDIANKADNLDSDDSSTSDSDSDSDDESDSRVIHGQKWVRTSNSSLPKLDSAILALSFKPHPASIPSTNSALGLHATRHNPHPVSHELPPSDTKLIAVTASHQVIEFDIMLSRISDWSKRNPSAYLPQSFTRIKDRTMGIFWDCDFATKRERMWLYGPNWLFMLDMTRDLSLVDAQDKVGEIGGYDVREPLSSSMIAQRAAGEITPLPLRRKRKRNTGAGDQKKPHDAFTLNASQRVDADEMEIDTGLLSPTSDDEDDDVDNDNAGALSQLRRETNLTQTTTDEETNSSITTPSHHIIFRYRSIFGIAALQHHDQEERQTATSDPTDQSITVKPNPTNNNIMPNLEIVLVERPLYDINLQPRFDSGQDWTV